MIWELRIEHMSTRRIKPKYVTKYGRRIKIKTRITHPWVRHFADEKSAN